MESDSQWRHLSRFSGAAAIAAPPPSPPAAAPIDPAVADRQTLEAMFTENWVARPDDQRRAFDRILNALIQETTDQPQEIWTSFEKHEMTGQVRAIEHRLRNAGSIGSWDVAFLVVKMVQSGGGFVFEDFWLETTVENLDREVRFGIRAKPDYFSRDRPH